MPSPSSPQERDLSPRDPKSDSAEKVRQRFRELTLASLGWNFVTAPLVGAALGYGVDSLIRSYPWAMIVGMLLGFAAAFIELIRSVR